MSVGWLLVSLLVLSLQMIFPQGFQALLAFPGFEKELEEELRHDGASLLEKRERLFLTGPLERTPVWSQQRWLNPDFHAIESIGNAAKLLRSLGKNGACYSFHLHRRSELIQEQLRAKKAKPLSFLGEVPAAPTAAWTLWDEKTLLASPSSDSAFPLGEVTFDEDSKNPPSRAYLKLWEAFTLHVPPPGRGARVIDLGSCPGGWTWVLAALGCETWSVDKAPLDPRVAKMKNVTFLKKDVFKLDPADTAPMDWVCSDVICTPDRLAVLVDTWEAANPRAGFVCTLKFKGRTDFASIDAFRARPGGKLVHLCANKHELTWIRPPQG